MNLYVSEELVRAPRSPTDSGRLSTHDWFARCAQPAVLVADSWPGGGSSGRAWSPRASLVRSDWFTDRTYRHSAWGDCP